MLKIRLLLILLLFHLYPDAQHIYMLHTRNESEPRYGKAETITGIEYFSRRKDTSYYRDSFDLNGRIYMHKKLTKNGKLIGRTQYNYDSVKDRLVGEKREWFDKIHSIELVIYDYDEHDRLVLIINTDSAGHPTGLCQVKTNSKGEPVELIRTTENKTYSWQKADYFYEKNSVVTVMYAEDGKITSTDTLAIDRHKPATLKKHSDVFNANGDIVKSYWPYQTGEYISEMIYKYDKYKNWEEIKIYELPNNLNQKKSKYLDRYFKRTIHYRKE